MNLVVCLFAFCTGLCLQLHLSSPATEHTRTRSPRKINLTMPYKPVVLVHGVLDTKSNLELFADTIREAHPGTEVTIIDLYTGLKSFLPLWDQIPKFRESIEEIAAKNPNGIHLVGISQGSVISRGVLQTSDKHNVHNFISVVGPQMGVYGFSFISKIPFYHWITSHMYKVFYNYAWEWFSTAEIWRDPNQMGLYKMENNFLPILNNEIIHPRAEEFKTNFVKIKRLVLIGGPDDQIITPWQSSQFGFCNTNDEIVPMQEQDVYKNDSFGLRTLGEREAIDIYTVPNIGHADFQNNVEFIKEYVLPYLT